MYTQQEPLGNHMNCQGKVHSEILFRKKNSARKAKDACFVVKLRCFFKKEMQ